MPQEIEKQEQKKPVPNLPPELVGFLWQYGMAGWGYEVARKNPKAKFWAADYDGRCIGLYGFR